jgi:hypothetical protein
MSPSFFLTDFTREIHEGDPEHVVATYSTATGTSTHCKHLINAHTRCYLKVLEQHGWPIYSDLKELIGEGWMLTGILHMLRDSTKTIKSLGPPPVQNSLPGNLPPGDVLPEFSLDEMHCQLVKFIVTDDQVSHSCSTRCCCSYLSSGYQCH